MTELSGLLESHLFNLHFCTCDIDRIGSKQVVNRSESHLCLHIYLVEPKPPKYLVFPLREACIPQETETFGRLPAKLRIFDSNFVHNSVKRKSKGSINSDSSVLSTKIGGGAIALLDRPGSIGVSSTQFDNNFAPAGGAILVDNFKSLSFNISNFTRNEAILGGAIASLNTEVEMKVENTRFELNNAQQGGALFLEYFSRYGMSDMQERTRLLNSAVLPPSVLQLTNSSFLRNEALLGGGAVDVSGLLLKCFNCTFYANVVALKDGGLNGEGGAMRIRAAAAVLIEESKVKSCKAHSGGGVSLWSSILKSRSTDWSANHANDCGAAVAGKYNSFSGIGDSVAVDIERCKFIDNTANRAGKKSQLHCNL